MADVPALHLPSGRTLVGSYLGLVELAEHELETLPRRGGSGRSARQGVALKVLQIVTQARQLPTVSGLSRSGTTRIGVQLL